MAKLLQDMGTFLTDNGEVTTDGVDLFRDFNPSLLDTVDAAEEIVILTEYPGDPASPYDTIVHRSVQVAVRGGDAESVHSKALRIFNLLSAEDRIIHFTSERWGQVYLRQTPFKFGSDANSRVTYAFNIGITTTSE